MPFDERLDILITGKRRQPSMGVGRRGAPGKLHERLIVKLREEQDARRSRFMRSLREAGIATTDADIRPDAFTIDTVLRVVVAFEVEVWNPMDRAKIAKYRQLRELIRYFGWGLVVIRVDASGEREPLFPPAKDPPTAPVWVYPEGT